MGTIHSHWQQQEPRVLCWCLGAVCQQRGCTGPRGQKGSAARTYTATWSPALRIPWFGIDLGFHTARWMLAACGTPAFKCSVPMVANYPSRTMRFINPTKSLLLSQEAATTIALPLLEHKAWSGHEPASSTAWPSWEELLLLPSRPAFKNSSPLNCCKNMAKLFSALCWTRHC